MEIIRGGSDRGFAQDGMVVLVNLLDACNLRCPYCANAHAGKGGKRILDRGQLLRLAEIARNLNKPEVRFAFAGGEPLLYPDLPRLLESLRALFPDGALTMSMASNLVCSLRKLEETLDAAGGALDILASVHFGQFDMERHFARLAKLPDRLLSRVTFKLLLSARTFSAVVDLAERLEEMKRFRFIVGLVWDAGGMADGALTPGQKKVAALLTRKYHGNPVALFTEFLHEGKRAREEFCNQDRVLRPELVAYGGLRCAAGFSSMRVGPDGGVRRCFRYPEEFFLKDLNAALPGNFYRPCRCPGPSCACAPLISLPKWSAPEDAPAWLPAVHA
jgi:hypothetical protein